MIEAAQTFLVLGFYVWTIFGLRTRVLETQVSLSHSEFRAAYPRQRWLPTVHATLSVFVFILSLLSGIFLADTFVQKPAAYGFGTLVFVAGMNTFNGLFEVATGICAIYGVTTKRYNMQRFVIHEQARRLGWVRLALSAGLAVVAVVLALVWSA